MNKLFLRSDDRFVAAVKEKPLRDREMQRLIWGRTAYFCLAMLMSLLLLAVSVVGILDNEPPDPGFMLFFSVAVMLMVLLCYSDNRIKTLRGLGELWDRCASDEAASPDVGKR